MFSSDLVRGIRFAVPLLAALVGLEQAARWGATHCYVHQAGKINLLMEHLVDPELAIFGASNGLAAFDAPAIERATGRRTYNFSMDGTPFVQYRALIGELATSFPACRDVVLAETFMTFMNLTALRTPSRYLPWIARPTVYPVFQQIDPALAWRLRYVPLYSLVVADQDYYKEALRGYLTLLGRPPANSEQQGFVAHEGAFVRSPSDPAPVVEHAPSEEWIVDALREAIALLNRNGKRVVVVITPLGPECVTVYPELEARRARLRSLVGDGNVYLDYTQAPLASDSANFYNCGHLNTRGARALSDQFVSDFSKLPR